MEVPIPCDGLSDCSFEEIERFSMKGSCEAFENISVASYDAYSEVGIHHSASKPEEEKKSVWFLSMQSLKMLEEFSG